MLYLFQIQNHLQKYKKEKNGPAVINLKDLTTFFRENSAVPQDLDTPFVLDYLISDTAKSAPDLQHYSEQEFKFACFLTTKRLLSHCLNANASIIHADSTYKLLWEDYPVHVFGITDHKKAFHLMGVGISTHETHAEYEFCFKAMKNGVMNIYEKELEWSSLMSDASGAIKKGFSTVHPHGLRLTCYFHVKKAIKSRNFNNKNNKHRILDDLSRLQASSDVTTFDKGSQLFVKKWIKKENEFVQYMEKYWLKHENKFFFEGSMPKTPSTNNALESTNGKIKIDFNLKHRYKMSEFKGKVMEMIRAFSTEYRDGAKRVDWEVPISAAVWKESLDWANSTKKVVEEKDSTTYVAHYYIPSNKDKIIEPKDLKMYKEQSWTTFDNFCTNIEMIWHIKITNNNIITATCTCPSYLKHYVCRHMLGIGLRLQLVSPPLQARKLSQRKNRRGRPKNNGSGLSYE